MNDNNEKYRIELSNEEYEYVEKLKQEYYKKSRRLCRLSGNDENAEESILNKFFRLTKKS